jgi:hypothetical protein
MIIGIPWAVTNNVSERLRLGLYSVRDADWNTDLDTTLHTICLISKGVGLWQTLACVFLWTVCVFLYTVGKMAQLCQGEQKAKAAAMTHRLSVSV